MEIPVSNVIRITGFLSEEYAAKNGCYLAMGMSQRDEYGGLLWLADGQYYYSEPVTMGSGYEFAARSGTTPANAVFVGLYHTHPSYDDIAKMFSVNDVKTAKELKVNSYIYVLADKSIRLFVPGQTPTFFYDTGDQFTSGDVSNGQIL